jgi:ribosomal protein S11
MQQKRGRAAACDRSPLSPSPEEQVSRNRWVMIVVLGLLVVGVFFSAGSCLGLYLAGGIPWSTVDVASPTPAEQAASPTSGSPMATAPSPTAKREPPLPTSTPMVPPVTPPAAATVAPLEPFSPDEWEPDGTPEEASPIEVGGAQRHNLHVGGDSDWLYFEAQAGRTYVVETAELGREVDTVICLYDAQGNELACDDDGGDGFLASRLWWLAADDGSLYVMVRGFADTEEGRGTEYSVSFRMAEGFETDEYEPDDSRAQASLITVGETQTHNRHVAGDEDWISFEVQQGITYVVQTLNLGVEADTVIYLYDAQGNELAFDDDGGEEAWASRLEWMPLESGIRYVKIEDWIQGSSGPETRYEVTLSLR